MRETISTRARADLFRLLDAFPEDAHTLHTAFAGDVINGGNRTGRVLFHFAGTEEEQDGCACAIGTIADDTGLLWDNIAARLGRPGAEALDTLPALEEFILDIRPDDNQRRTKTVTRWIEEWMIEQDAK